ncbi:MAG TPA: Asp-tRNA(Asn)/Glu-tRNA(Gln) amidotransferase subunit GatB [Campylobacterales bacterium]|nr:Asp-tRNA(Asn)/Glu-tRNA(Gln) amidotransferase subunit GatB [Campylobacterales bacterium]
MEFEVVIGLEVHVQLNTKTKLFCSCPTSFNEKENSNTCPTCLALPGALPVINREAIHKAIQFGTAVNASINRYSKFDRKNYFYPDLPSGYQISQFYKPIVENGYIEVNGRKIGIVRAHLEADAGKNIHESNYSKVDLNRAGTPLLEIVSAPDLRSSDEAIEYLKKLHSIVRYIDISDANMQEGSFRCDANVSIRPKGDTKLYTRVEIKNINSFRFIQRAIDYEVERQIEAWEDGVYEDEVIQETRLYDSVKNETRSMRGKEESADYRYFPEPDLLEVYIDDETLETYSKIPELPDEKAERFQTELGLSEYDAKVISSSIELANFFEEMINSGASVKNSVTWLTVELLGRLNKNNLPITSSPISSSKLSDLVKAIDNKTISGKAGKDILDYLMEHDISVDEAIEKLGLKQVNDDSAILKLIDEVLSKNSDKVEEYKQGKTKLFGFFVGQVMKASRGSANPQKVNELLRSKLS